MNGFISDWRVSDGFMLDWRVFDGDNAMLDKLAHNLRAEEFSANGHG